jgi:hypothetical protein
LSEHDRSILRDQWCGFTIGIKGGIEDFTPMSEEIIFGNQGKPAEHRDIPMDLDYLQPARGISLSVEPMLSGGFDNSMGDSFNADDHDLPPDTDIKYVPMLLFPPPPPPPYFKC